MGSGQLCKICRSEGHNVVKGTVTCYRLEQQCFAASRALLTMREQSAIPEPSVAARLDAIDRQILKEVQDDGRITNVELARRVGISAPPCLRRVRALEQAGYIKGYRALLDEKLLGRGDRLRDGAPEQPGGSRPQSLRGFRARAAHGARMLDALGRDRLHPQMRGA